MLYLPACRNWLAMPCLHPWIPGQGEGAERLLVQLDSVTYLLPPESIVLLVVCCYLPPFTLTAVGTQPLSVVSAHVFCLPARFTFPCGFLVFHNLTPICVVWLAVLPAHNKHSHRIVKNKWFGYFTFQRCPYLQGS